MSDTALKCTIQKRGDSEKTPFGERREKFNEKYSDLPVGKIRNQLFQLKEIEITKEPSYKDKTVMEDKFVLTFVQMQDENTPLLNPENDKPFAFQQLIKVPKCHPSEKEYFQKTGLHNFTQNLDFTIPENLGDDLYMGELIGLYVEVTANTSSEVSQRSGKTYNKTNVSSIYGSDNKKHSEHNRRALERAFPSA